MIRVKESTKHKLLGHSPPCPVENSLSIEDQYGRKGIDLFHENDIVFVHGDEKADIGISMHGNPVKGVSKNRCILLKIEPPTYNIFYGWNLCNPRYLKKYATVLSTCKIDGLDQEYFTFPVLTFRYVDKFFDKPKTEFLDMVLRNKKLAMRLNSFVPRLRKYNKYSNMKMRTKADNKFCDYFGHSKYHTYGRGWCEKCFKGTIPLNEGKQALLDVISRYKFSFTPENSRFKGWITEKPINAMCCGSVPIYIGPPDVEKYLPRGTFIDYMKYSPQELCEYIENMDEKEYQSYRGKIRSFVTSRKVIEKFSLITYAKKILSVIKKIT